jgi:protein-tyrosine-phosphatase
MIIHFICRGNAFRSIIAEAYMNSLELKDLSVLSSGTAAVLHKARNLANHRITLELLEEHGIRGFTKAHYGDQLTQSRLDKADITVCVNQRVYDECLRCVTFSASPRVWSVADIGEPGRISDIESERQFYREEAYQEIVRNVDRLVLDVLGGKARLMPIADKRGTRSSRQIRKSSGRRLWRRRVPITRFVAFGL